MCSYLCCQCLFSLKLLRICEISFGLNRLLSTRLLIDTREVSNGCFHLTFGWACITVLLLLFGQIQKQLLVPYVFRFPL